MTLDLSVRETKNRVYGNGKCEIRGFLKINSTYTKMRIVAFVANAKLLDLTEKQKTRREQAANIRINMVTWSYLT